MTWPDLVIGGIALIFGLKGWKRGFVGEIGGFIALAVAIWAGLHYPGTLDGVMHDYFHINPGSAHIAGMVAFAVLVYVVLLVIAAVLGRIAKLPVIGLGNSLGGAAVGIAKVLIGAWAVLFVALFFPLSNDLRGDLRRSTPVALVTSENAQIDDAVKNTMPGFVRPFVEPFFVHHRV
ncbi:MAG TPA: CvpA family protein [Dongiaceae bacterium]|nr:CvpA family protein [Dongiaceae bacterium]